MRNDNKLKKITDLATILGLLSSAKEHESQVYLWRLIGNTKHLAGIKIEAIRKSRKDFAIVPRDGQDRQVQEIIGSQDYLDLYIPDSGVLLRCQLRHADSPFRYYLYLPQYLAQVDRRSSFRINVFEQSEMQLSFGKTSPGPRSMNQFFLKNCFDLSLGGFSFLVSRPESKFFATSDQILNVDIKAGPWSTKLDAEITSIREVEPDEFNELSYKVWRICCRITKLDQISRKHLEKFIFDRIKQDLHAINQ